MNPDIFYNMINRRRNIYELADLFPQNRHDESHFIHLTKCIHCNNRHLISSGEGITCGECSSTYEIKDNIVNFNPNTIPAVNSKWEELNKKFLRYHKSLTPFTLLNSAPRYNYLAYKTGLGKVKNARVLDVGGGNGHPLCSFFHYPEKIDYYLIDPNIRLLHDQYIRVYPKLIELKISHFLGCAEKLPFIDNSFDIVICQNAIDHLQDYHKFISEAHNILKPGGVLFIAGSLEMPNRLSKWLSIGKKLFSFSLLEKFIWQLYIRRYRAEKDAHTYHFESYQPIMNAMTQFNFSIAAHEDFFHYFYVIGAKR